MKSHLKNLYIWTPRFEDEGGASGEPTEPTPSPEPSTGAHTQQTFTQDDLNRILAKERRGFEDKMGSMTEEIDALKKKSTLTADERKGLESRLEEIKNRSATEEQRLGRQIKSLNKKYEEDVTSAKAEAATWQKRFTDQMINTSLTSAAAAGDAFNTEQVVAILQPQTSLVALNDDEGKPTGEYEVRITQPGKNDKGEAVVFERTPSEVIKLMREDERFFNLFKGSGVGGAGSISRPGQNSKTPTDPSEYIRQRRAGTLKI